MRRVAIVGASLAGLTVADRLRELGYDGAIQLIGDEDVAPYDRPPLSKEILYGDWTIERALLRAPKHYRESSIDLCLNARATGLDVNACRVTLASGEAIEYDDLIIATGARPKRPAFLTGKTGIHYLRNAQDGVALRQAFAAKPRVVIVGAGFIGMEAASAARRLGLDVTIVELQPYPLFRAVGPELGKRLVKMLEAANVTMRFRMGIQKALGDGAIEGVELSDGSRLAADLLLVSVGSSPASEWLEASGLQLRDGVVCDEFCRVRPNIFAVGDVASLYDVQYNGHVRSEHWTGAVEQAKVAAANVLNKQSPLSYSASPYVWSDQFAKRLQIVGMRQSGDSEVVVRDKDPRRIAALYRGRDKLTAVATLNWPTLSICARPLIAEKSEWSFAIEKLKLNEQF